MDSTLIDDLNQSTEEYEDLYRLPDNISPTHYRLTLDPDLENGTFEGEINITIDVKELTNRIFLNAHQLSVKNVRVYTHTGPLLNIPDHTVDSVRIQHKRQLIVITLLLKLNPGSYSVLISYRGNLNSDTVGFYRTKTNNIGDPPRYCAATYFEPTYARFAYPCFDEPHFKAHYSVSLIRPSGDDYIALSNSSVKSEVFDFPRQGVTTVHFEETKPISSYLTCFIIGVFSRLEPATALSGELPVSVYSKPDLVNQTAFARDLAASVLDFFSKYFVFDYPFPKLDLIAIPDSKLSGMENWGLITFRDSALLINPGESSMADYLTVVRIVVHELSHMWFGNLVTIAWWNDTWLKEGMANFMALIGGHYKYPSWYNEWAFLIGEMYPALQKDSALSSHPVILSVSHPDQIREMFDTISYLKGSCLIRMLHDLDSSKFQKGLHRYIHKMKWSDATTADLWSALGTELGWSVSDIMKPWTQQTGYPLLTVSNRGSDFVLTQSRFLSDSSAVFDPSSSPYNYLWDIPIKYITSENPTKTELIWLYKENDSVSIRGSDAVKWIKLNWHNVGFFRVNYSSTIWNNFSNLLSEDHTLLDSEDRSSLINDAFCLASAGYVKYDVPLSLILYLKDGKEDHFLVWYVVQNHLKKMQALLNSPTDAQQFNKFIRLLLKSVISNLNWDTSESVPYLERKLRVELIRIACTLGFSSVLERIRAIFCEWIEKKKCKPPLEIRSIVHSFGLSQEQREDLWDKAWQQYLQEQNPGEIMNLLRSLASTNNPNLIHRLISEAKNSDMVRSQDFFILMKLISETPTGNKIVWNFIRNEWPYFVSRFTLNDINLGVIIRLVTSDFCSDEQLNEVQEFFSTYPESGAGATERKHTIETIKANIKWKDNNASFLEDWFSSF